MTVGLSARKGERGRKTLTHLTTQFVIFGSGIINHFIETPE